MKAFSRLIILIVIVFLSILAVTNVLLINDVNSVGERPYRVEVNRLSAQIEINGYNNINLDDCEYIISVTEFGEDFYNSENEYVIHEIDGKLYRFDYVASKNKSSIYIANISIIAAFSVALILLIYIKKKIIAPLEKMTDLPYELSRGNLTAPIPEEKNRYFGRMVWGLNLLRETTEQQKEHELEFQRERKTKLISLSHDLKTPLSAIKLYSKALSEGLYSDKEKQKNIAVNIGAKADEIEGYIDEIISASRDYVVPLEVVMSEFYLSELEKRIIDYYKEKLRLTTAQLIVGRNADCLVKGDLERSVEVLQNIVENALKYGDGGDIFLDFSFEEACTLITVTNGGCRLKPEELPHIFESFWRGSNAESNQGSGLGLYICRQLMNKMGGEAFAEIKGENIAVSVVFNMA